MFISERLCAEHMTQLPRLKVTSQGQVIYPWISCPLHIFWTLRAIFIKLYPNVPLSETMCRTYDSATHTQGQGHTSRSCDLLFNLCPLHISWILLTIFIKHHSNVFSQWVGVQDPWLSYANSKSWESVAGDMAVLQTAVLLLLFLALCTHIHKKWVVCL